jgi:murein DD-endopeptidase MepM/ murein hydrolase activator NlpD
MRFRADVHAMRADAHVIIAAVPSRSRTKSWVLVVLVLVLAVVGSVSYLGWRQSVPGVRAVVTPPPAIGHKSTIPLVVQATRGQVARVEARVRQGGGSGVALTEDGALGARVEIPLTIDSATLGLREGAATLEIWGRDDFWRPLRQRDRLVASVPLTIDLTPPRIDIVASTQYLAPGGVGVVVFRVAGAARSDVSVGAVTFPSFGTGGQERVALVALPYNFAPGTPIKVSGQDEAGNLASRGIAVEILPRRFRNDRIEVRDAFLELKVPELLPQRPPAQPLIDGFLVINRDLRRQAEEAKRRFAAKTADKPLWEGVFVQPRNTKVFSNFAETRTYIYGGREIDRQVHFGFDLASTKQAPVPAANTGTVAFVGPLTIYGNTVVVDHGWGLMTLYAHLSSIAVKVGDAVAKGQELGRSGDTGLAVGDHLHYEVLVNGMSVTPIEWWDAKWIRDRFNGPLKAAGLPGIAGLDDAGRGDGTREAPGRPRPRRAR